MVWTGVLLLDYDAVEGAGAVLSHRLYIEAAGSEADEKVSIGWQCLSILIDGRRNDGDGGFCVSWSGPYCRNTSPQATHHLAGSTSRRRGGRAMKRMEEIDSVVYPHWRHL